jgi:hypothetical protein
MRKLRVAAGDGAQRPGLHGQLDPVRTHIHPQVTVCVLPAGGDRGGSHLAGLNQ